MSSGHSSASISAMWQAIPLATATGLEIERLDGEGIRVRAPFARNCNHMQTAFAGSLLTLGTLAGWALAQSLLEGTTADIVLQESEARFLHPVRGEIVAQCAQPSAEAIGRFRAGLRDRGRGRIRLVAAVHDADRLAFEFSGRFVALRRSVGG